MAATVLPLHCNSYGSTVDTLDLTVCARRVEEDKLVKVVVVQFTKARATHQLCTVPKPLHLGTKPFFFKRVNWNI
jgi:hypothetical protein